MGITESSFEVMGEVEAASSDVGDKLAKLALAFVYQFDPVGAAT